MGERFINFALDCLLRLAALYFSTYFIQKRANSRFSFDLGATMRNASRILATLPNLDCSKRWCVGREYRKLEQRVDENFEANVARNFTRLQTQLIPSFSKA